MQSSQLSGFQEAIPLWVVTALFAGLLLLSFFVGSRLRRFVAIDPATVAAGQLVVGIVTVFTLLVGFTFSLALNRHDQRQDVLLAESNSIRALHRTLAHVGQPGRAEIGTALHAYAQGRLKFAQSNLFDQEAQLDKRAKERERLSDVVTNGAPRSDADVSQTEMLHLLTSVLDAGTRMDMIALAHVPARVILLLVLLPTGSAMVIGMAIGDRIQGLWFSATIWSSLVSLALFTIVDLDSTHWGSIRLDHGPLERAVRATSDLGG